MRDLPTQLAFSHPENFFRTQIGSNGRFARVVSYVVRKPTPAVFRQRDPMNVRPTAVEKRLTRLSTLIVNLLLVSFGFCWTRFLDLRLVGLDWTLFTAFICFHCVCVFICIFGRLLCSKIYTYELTRKVKVGCWSWVHSWFPCDK